MQLKFLVFVVLLSILVLQVSPDDKDEKTDPAAKPQTDPAAKPPTDDESNKKNPQTDDKSNNDLPGGEKANETISTITITATKPSVTPIINLPNHTTKTPPTNIPTTTTRASTKKPKSGSAQHEASILNVSALTMGLLATALIVQH